MTPTQLRDWRRRLGMNQAAAAERLGLALRTYQNYETGRRSDSARVDHPVPWTVVLATRAITAGLDGDREARHAAVNHSSSPPVSD